MDFRYSTEQDAFRSSLSGFLSDAAPLAQVRKADGYDPALWQRLCNELELPGLHVPPEYGGAGATLVETAIVFSELGRALTPVPLAATTFAIEAVVRAGDEDQRSRLLKGLLSGEQVGALAVAGPHDCDPNAAQVRAHRDGDGTVLTGVCTPVLHGAFADLFIVPAVADGAVTLHVVEANDPGVNVVSLPSFDITRPVARLELAQASAEELTAGSADEIERVLDVARMLLAAEMLGGSEQCLTMAVEYACTRKQFGRAIGSFQAVKHACAEMMIEIDATRAAVMYAAMSAADDQELQITAPLAKAQAADTFVLCAGSAIQVHGGIAFTWEHDLHLYFRRATTTQTLFGSSTHHRELLADRAGL
ncbi:acyl-CoA dehydrogenase family protein [Mycobacterium sp. 2YAF39]|uniref:acyl-CoA dehydrogenase family protein n=1 Tax=Mycobacterium sp. 2YAF39 TaxID=3233033 RepID=UPI003F9CB2C7